MTIIKDNSLALNIKSDLDLLKLIDKAFDRFSYNGQWQDITEENRKQMKLKKDDIHKYYEYRRLALALKKLIQEKNTESVIEDDTMPSGEYNLVEGWNDGHKVIVK